ncbi:hypothetical protein K8354_15365 [Polaribacter litorisediminis]|uniref:hypothetical protein n=1 Tax=Polaribacter litorisediminis TaxID=1908341 RepID=UPI001CBE723C|nr:hypothetical protein [Polaribacter litorisediminis]UAM97662.1 hypothetical protein K8354_15365 [Polaribacter litorisediminis]
MELSKKQIQYIENRLEKNGITYWDIRLELLDHVVSDIESRLEIGESYNSALENSFYSLQLNRNLEGLNKKRLLDINKIVRKQYFNKVVSLFTSPKSFILMLFLISLYSLVFLFGNYFVFKTITIFLLFTPITLGLVLYFKEFLRMKKSGYLVYSSFYIFFSFLMLNLFLQFPKPDGIFPVTKETQLFIWFLVTCINSIFSVAGILIHLKNIKNIKAIKQKLIGE